MTQLDDLDTSVGYAENSMEVVHNASPHWLVEGVGNAVVESYVGIVPILESDSRGHTLGR